jgi:hypothetical protein
MQPSVTTTLGFTNSTCGRRNELEHFMNHRVLIGPVRRPGRRYKMELVKKSNGLGSDEEPIQQEETQAQ